MDLSIWDKFLILIKNSFSSFLLVEEFILFVIILFFLLFNEKFRNKKVSVCLSLLLIYIFSIFVFVYKEDVLIVLTEIGKLILNCFYFPNIIFYIFTVMLSLIILLYTIFATKLNKKLKIISYIFSLLHLYLFGQFITVANDSGISITTTPQIYQNNTLFSIVQASQIIFILHIIYFIVRFFILRKRNLKKNTDSAIMDKK